jgi:phage terminase small subunit
LRSASGLTRRQETFCRAVAHGGDPCAAYRRAFRCERLKPETVERKAAGLLGRGEIASAIWGLRDGVAAQHAVTIERLSRELEEARALALAKGHSAAAVSATLGKAKLHGLPPDRKGAPSISIEAMSDDELDAYIGWLESELHAETGRRDAAGDVGN